MIEYKTGNILDDPSDAIVIPVNCVGIMGAGLAKQAKLRWPKMYEEYREACREKLVRPGKVWIWLDGPKLVMCFPTKRHFNDPSRLGDIEIGIEAMHKWVSDVLDLEDDPGSIAVPPLGCGLGGLAWSDVKPLLEAFAERVADVKVVVYEPRGRS